VGYLDPRGLPPIAQPKDGWFVENGEFVWISGGVVVLAISAPHLMHLIKFVMEALGKLFEKLE
jgi:hypothetical protein